MADPSTHALTVDPAAQHRHHGAGRYVAIYFALIGLTITTYLTAQHDLGRINLPLALLIAVTKATMVVLFFMHLWEHRGTSAVVFATSLFFVCLLMLFVLADVHTRFRLINPPESNPDIQFGRVPDMYHPTWKGR